MFLMASGLKTLQPAVQYLAGELAVEAGMVMPLRAAHNTVAMRFDIEV
jgi:type III protein arginine methyltransferase